ncbi:cupin domain-containing protein [Azospirillum canadense]|uniref:cupin domain-containing protein n=1 Tax=Azospirillum canadense TaxID=403962 RepID=UPI002227D6FB|nr:cupin domain-containing protein [Azospirillum canadense]MCW2241024.1 putative cupin superfamily protein [Azospirillum canadense]
MSTLTVIENTAGADIVTSSKIYPTAIAPTAPEVRVHVVHRSEDTGRTAGVWELTVGKCRLERTVDEVFVLLSGVWVLTADGTVTTLRAGDTALLPKGWKGIGEVVETVRKVYATFPSPA